MKANVYVDGFHLYYSALRWRFPNCKWLDVPEAGATNPAQRRHHGQRNMRRGWTQIEHPTHQTPTARGSAPSSRLGRKAPYLGARMGCPACGWSRRPLPLHRRRCPRDSRASRAVGASRSAVRSSNSSIKTSIQEARVLCGRLGYDGVLAACYCSATATPTPV